MQIMKNLSFLNKKFNFLIFELRICSRKIIFYFHCDMVFDFKEIEFNDFKFYSINFDEYL
jgi:hypothetical protein